MIRLIAMVVAMVEAGALNDGRKGNKREGDNTFFFVTKHKHQQVSEKEENVPFDRRESDTRDGKSENGC